MSILTQPFHMLKQRPSITFQRVSTKIPQIVPPLLILFTLFLWIGSLSHIQYRDTNDYGLVSVLPITFYAAILSLTMSFALVVHHGATRIFLLLAHVVALILIIHGTPALLYETPRYAWTYKHIGVAEYIQRNGSIDPTIDIYFNWPTFFALSAFFTTVAGLDSALSIAAWAPVFFNCLYLGGMLLIASALTTDRRLIWFSVWLFFLTNWIGQDYYAPQAMGYFFHLIVLGICLRWLRAEQIPDAQSIGRWIRFPRVASLLARMLGSGATNDLPKLPDQPKSYIAAVLSVVICFTFIVASHQLSPFMTIACVTALVVAQRCRARSLPALLTLITVIWIVYVAQTYTQGKLAEVLQSIGSINDTLHKNIAKVEQHTSGHTFVTMMRYALTVLVWALGCLGFVRRFFKGYNDLAAALIACMPFGVMLMQSYGGEMLLRVYFFSQPGMVFLAAALLYDRPRIVVPWRLTLASISLSVAVLCVFVFAYYGSERMNYFSAGELQAYQYIGDHAVAKTAMFSITSTGPQRFSNYEKIVLEPLLPDARTFPDTLISADTIYRDMVDRRAYGYQKEYLIFNRGQFAHVELLSLLKHGEYEQIRQQIVHDSRFVRVYGNEDADVFILHDVSKDQ